jgi:hypothetical protein
LVQASALSAMSGAKDRERPGTAGLRPCLELLPDIAGREDS